APAIRWRHHANGGGRVLGRVRPQSRILHGLRVRAHRAGARGKEPARGWWPLRRLARRCRSAHCYSCRGVVHSHRTPARARWQEWPVSNKLILALPSKGRLMEQCNAALAKAGLTVARTGARGYKGEIAELPGVEVNFVSALE